MDGAAALVLMLSAMAVLLVGVESQQRVCYSGPPPEPDPDNPDDWMKQVMQEIRKRCPGRRQPTLAECSSPQPLGMEDGTIQGDRITASGSYTCCRAYYGRLNHDKGWTTSSGEANPWIEVDLVQSTVVTGVTTQGDGSDSFVTAYKVAYKKQPSSDREHVMDGNGNIKVFIGNTDIDTPVTNLFDESVVATVVRIEPTGSFFYPALRLELLGCRRG
ncbi:EGF-like repeat and discoidin I-like domain-containing protein 3 [Patiria miniata]|uniref:F5/8 type C domain-containing protein n=1 Tax=Patiria miniata TaxID=46514 RepID=A0A914A8Y2_PATMI|nr:EGF-like repeat and discoidin I-like domain-containing protein 3 [Patiria miniata]